MFELGREKALSIVYGTFLIVSLEILFLRIFPQLYPLINTIPLLFLAQLLKLLPFLYSIIFSIFFFFLINNFDFLFGDIFSTKLFLNFITISSIIFYLSFLLNKKEIKDEKVLVNLVLFSIIVVNIIIFFFFSENEQAQLREYFLKFTKEFLKSSNELQNVNSSSLVDIIVKIIPGINIFSFLTTLLLNFQLTRILIEKMNFRNIYTFRLTSFEIPNWVFLMFNIFLLLSIMMEGDAKYFFLNCLIVLSFLIFYEGFAAFYKIFKKYEINNFLKFLIIFLLFIFLGYVLFLVLFVIGFYINLKKVLSRVIKT